MKYHILTDEEREALLSLALCLMVTNDCNFACKYCFIRRLSDCMNEEICRKAIDYFFDISSPAREVLLYEGEPLLNWNLCRLAVEYIKTKDNKIVITMTTNGSLVTKEIASFFARAGVNVSVSIDGPKEINDSVRKDLNGNGTFERTMNGYKLFKEAGINLGVSCTIGSHNIKTLPEITEWIITKLEPVALGFNAPILEKNHP